LKNQNQLVVAVVSKFFSTGQYGFANDSTTGQDYHFHMAACRRVEAGRMEPEFTDEWMEWPRIGDGIVLIPHRYSNGLVKAWPTYRWGHKKFWDKAVKEIDARPLYRVTEAGNRFQGKFLPGEVAGKEVVRGSLAVLQRDYPRGVKNDPLGTEESYRSGPCQRVNRW